MSLSRPLPGEYAEGLSKYIDAVPDGDLPTLLRAQAAEVEAVFGGLGEDQGGFRYAPGKWSLKDLLQHLTDCERIFGYRCMRIGRGDATPLAGFDDNAYAAAAQADARPVSALLADFRAAREANLALFASLPGAAWTCQGNTNGRVVSARCLPHLCYGHAAHHLGVVRERYLPGLR